MDIFRKPEDVMPIVEEAIKVGTKVVWMQEGIINEEAATRARDAGLTVVMDKCMRKEHMRSSAGIPRLMVAENFPSQTTSKPKRQGCHVKSHFA